MRSLFRFLLVLSLVAAAPAGWAADAPTVSVWDSFFPDGLMDAEKQSFGTDVLQGKLVGIYFSAHWCPDCRKFSPRLVTFRGLNQAEFEVVFVSSDKDEAAQFEYMKALKMKWYTIKYKSPAADALKAKYGITKIPTLVVVAPDGKTITLAGQLDVQNAPETCLASWKGSMSPRPVAAP